jgi:hypothetical protein
VPPGGSSRAYQEPLEAIASRPQRRFYAVQQPTPLARELQLAFDVIQRQRCELSPRVCALSVLESLSQALECLLGLEDALGDVMRHTE